jgi:subtilase-type serine protease
MQSTPSFATLRRALLGATSITAALIAATSAQAQDADRPTGVEDSPAIVVNNNLNPNAPEPTGVLDGGVTGVGQMIAFIQPANSPNAAGLSLCTGTLINPRTVIFAAHCVNTRPAHMYGSQTGTSGGTYGAFGTTQGVPLSFGFNATNRCTGTATAAGNGCLTGTGPYERWRDTVFTTQADRNIYNANQVWYDPRSLGPNSSGFLEADVALATLDTPAFDVPSWTMLFSPLTEQTHAFSVGYGVNGTSATAQGPTPCTTSCGLLGAIDYRRRIVENSLSVLGSLQDRNIWLFGNASAGPNHQSLYMVDFDSPAGQAAYTGAFNSYDFDVFNGPALPREGTTAGGDSGGPLVVDQRFDRPVTVAVLSGGSRFFNGQRFSTYGTHSFYQPLFLFWDQIVANNSYAYVGAKAGDGNWEDGSHWLQLMDPNYAIEVDGELVSSLPDTPALGVSGNTVKFGEVCFLDQCTDLANDDTATAPPTGNGTPIQIAGGPGSTNFVPDNVTPVNSTNPALSVRARYYDVTLSEAGTTTLSSARTVDVLTLDGAASKLKIASGASLNVLGEVNQWQGWTQVDGLLKAGRDTFIGSGILSGSGTIQAPFVTVAAAIVAPGGGDRIGTLTVNGNVILSSASSLFIDVTRDTADLLAVGGTLSLSDSAAPGASLVFNKVTDAPAPRHGDKFAIASATGGFLGRFGQIYSFQGVLRPELTYGANTILAEMRAGSLVEILDNANATEIAFAGALDALRASSYNSLYGLYGVIDLMDGGTLARTLSGLAPTRITGEALSLQERQSKVMLGTVSNRLSSLGTSGTQGTLTIVGSPTAVLGLSGDQRTTSSLAQFGSSNLVSGQRTTGAMPANMSGFVSGGVSTSSSTFGDNSLELAGQRSWHVGMGLEVAVTDKLTFGTAFGYANGYATPGGEQARADSKLSQAVAYASYQLGDGVYVAGLAAAERSRTNIDRQAFSGDATFALTGATEAARYTAMTEAGVNLKVGRGLTLTPRASLGYSSYQLSGFRENGGELALKLNDVTLQRLEAKVGARFAGSASLGAGWSFVPQLQADWVQNLAGGKDGMTVRFASAPGYAFALPLAGGDGGWGEVKGGMKLTNGRFEFGAGVESSIGRSDVKDDRAIADFTFRF